MRKNGRYAGVGERGTFEFSRIESLVTFILYPLLRIAKSRTLLAVTSRESFCRAYFLKG